MLKKIICFMLSAVILGSTVTAVYADEESDLKEKRDEAQSELSSTNEKLEELAEEQKAVQSEIKDINADIVDLMVRIDQAKKDIDRTQGHIEDTQAGIEKTKQDLAAAEETRDQQYADMKKRIQFVYEKGGDIGWAGILFTAAYESDDVSLFFNKAEYTEQLHSYDREQLNLYIQSVDSIKALEEQLEGELAFLEEQKENYEAQKVSLEEDEKDLEAKLEEAKEQNENYEEQIAEAKEQAERITELIEETEREIARVQEEKRRAEEEARRRAEEEARRREEEARRAEEARREEESRRQAAAAAALQAEEAGRYASYYSGSGVSGSSIVAYADQFLGNPYVWGGNSLTNGCDCSHFVYLVLRNTGAYGGGYATSGEWAYLGTKVSSLSEARAGDVIVYSGHVAIYDGNGGIVEAKGSAYGITHDRSATCKSIVAIRRFT